MVTTQEFLDAFTDEWNHDLEEPNIRMLLDAYQDTRMWTDYMLEGKGAFLKRVAGRLNLSMQTGRFNLDAIYHDAATDLFPRWGQIYPACLEVYIEHENGEYPEEEMYKLLMWRAPLKVLIFYDWSKDQQKCNQNRQAWLTEKLTEMFRMGRAIDGRWSEAQGTEYLFLVGQTEQQGQPPTWRYLCVQDERWPEQQGNYPYITENLSSRLNLDR